MNNKIVDHIVHRNRFHGIEHKEVDSQTIHQYCLLKKKGKELLLERSEHFKSSAELKENISKHESVSLCINTSKVLYRFLEMESQNSKMIIGRAFPNLDMGNFYFEIFIQDNMHHVFLARKDYIEDIIQSYNEIGILVVDFSLGNSRLPNTLLFMDKSVERIQTSNATAKVDQGKIHELVSTKQPEKLYNLNGQKVNSNEILAFLSALALATSLQTNLKNFENKIEDLRKDHIEKGMFDVAWKTFGVAILILLLVNYLAFQYYYNQNTKLDQIAFADESRNSQINSLEKLVLEKERIAERLIKNQGSNATFYIDDLISIIDEHILLNCLEFQPLAKRIKEDQRIIIDEKTILVSGTSTNSQSYSNLLNVLEQRKWVKEVMTMDYKDIDNNTSEFQLKIKIDDN